jgi:hypothetical protein
MVKSENKSRKKGSLSRIGDRKSWNYFNIAIKSTTGKNLYVEL